MDPRKEVPEDEDLMEEVSGTKVGHGKAPLALIVIFLVVIVWAVLAWIRPSGT